MLIQGLKVHPSVTKLASSAVHSDTEMTILFSMNVFTLQVFLQSIQPVLFSDALIISLKIRNWFIVYIFKLSVSVIISLIISQLIGQLILQTLMILFSYIRPK